MCSEVERQECYGVSKGSSIELQIANDLYTNRYMKGICNHYMPKRTILFYR